MTVDARDKMLKKNEDVEYPRKYQDYTVTVHEEQIPDSVEVRRMN